LDKASDGTREVLDKAKQATEEVLEKAKDRRQVHEFDTRTGSRHLQFD
jgi:hypothetical protein